MLVYLFADVVATARQYPVTDVVQTEKVQASCQGLGANDDDVGGYATDHLPSESSGDPSTGYLVVLVEFASILSRHVKKRASPIPLATPLLQVVRHAVLGVILLPRN